MGVNYLTKFWAQEIRARIGACLLVLFSFAIFGLALSQLSTESFWYDEAYSWTVIHTWLDSDPMIPADVNQDNHPPTYYRLLSVWAGWFGVSEFSLRFPSAVFFILTIPVAYFTGRLLHSHRAGLYAAFLCLTSAVLFAQAQEARSYAMLTLTCSAMLFCMAYLVQERRTSHYLGKSLFALCCRRAPSRKDLQLDAAWAGAGALMLFAMCTHYVALTFPALLGVILLVTIMTRRTKRHVIINGAAIGICGTFAVRGPPVGFVCLRGFRQGHIE